MNTSFRIRRNIFRYRAFFVFWIVLFILILLFLLVTLFLEVFTSFKVLNQVKSILKSDYENISEEFIFKAGKFDFIYPEKDGFYNVRGFLTENQSTKVSFAPDANFDYTAKGFSSEIFFIQNGKDLIDWSDKYDVSSNFLTLGKTKIKLFGNVMGKLISRSNPKSDGTILMAEHIDLLFETKYIVGEKPFVRNKDDVLKADFFEIFINKDLMKFWKNVSLESLNYKILSNKLDVILQNKEVKELLFYGDVKFFEKSGDFSRVLGSRAIYDLSKSEISIYGNVRIFSKKNNLKIVAESFHYNDITKRGYFKSAKNNNGKSKVEIELDI